MTAALVIAALLAVAAVVLAALPFLREPAPVVDRLDEQDELERRSLALAEERDRALAALKELEFDHRTGKVSDDDYRRLVGPLRAAAAEALRALEPAGRVRMVEAPEPPEPVPPEPVPDSVPEPYPPPDEATPPEPAIVPEPGPARIPEPGPR
jgi:outer membrane biosynthesis protein TonB